MNRLTLAPGGYSRGRTRPAPSARAFPVRRFSVPA